MTVTANDLVLYGSASMPDDDSTLNIGGAIDTTKRVVFSDIVATDQIEAISDNAGDTTQTLTVVFRGAAGDVLSEVLNLNGTTVVTSVGSPADILKMTLSGVCTGTVTVRDQDTDTTIATFEPGLLEIRRPFHLAASAPVGGGQRKFYEKVFYKNTHATSTLSQAVISEQADASGKLAFALESTLDGTDTNGAGNNRQVAPGGYTFNSDAKNVANSQNHTAGSGQGIWLELTLAEEDPAAEAILTLRETGINA